MGKIQKHTGLCIFSHYFFLPCSPSLIHTGILQQLLLGRGHCNRTHLCYCGKRIKFLEFEYQNDPGIWKVFGKDTALLASHPGLESCRMFFWVTGSCQTCPKNKDLKSYAVRTRRSRYGFCDEQCPDRGTIVYCPLMLWKQLMIADQMSVPLTPSTSHICKRHCIASCMQTQTQAGVLQGESWMLITLPLGRPEVWSNS